MEIEPVCAKEPDPNSVMRVMDTVDTEGYGFTEWQVFMPMGIVVVTQTRVVDWVGTNTERTFYRTFLSMLLRGREYLDILEESTTEEQVLARAQEFAMRCQQSAEEEETE